MGFVNHLPTRRELLVGSGALFAWSQMPRIARAEGRDPRLLVVVLRGALDGLGAVAPGLVNPLSSTSWPSKCERSR